MVKRTSHSSPLTLRQQRQLLEIINEDCGANLTFTSFADKLLALFEDISGLETITKSHSSLYVNQLWRKYRGKETDEG
jgi:hypothetical protein